MLDLKFILQNPELIQYACDKKHIKDFNVKDLIQVNTRRLDLLKEVESMRAEQNSASDKISSGTLDSISRESLISKMKDLKEGLVGKEESLKQVMAEWQRLMLLVPNIPDMTVPEGESDEQNVEIKVWGEKTVFPFEPKDHVELMLNLGMVDFERGTKVHGFRGYFLTGDGVMLTMAIWNYALEFWNKKGFMPIIAPAVVRKQSFIANGYLPQGEEDLYKTQDADYLIGTAEVSLMGMFGDEVLTGLEEKPLKYLGFSPCYRREAGAYSKDTKGLIRVHEFYKWEQVVLCEASHVTSVNLHEEINRNTEEFIESMKIPYHTVVNCGGDLGQGQVKKFDIELWVPKEEKYREISSASYFHDFQTRRGNVKYKAKDGSTKFAHSLNCTAIPTPRILVSLAENYQNADGSITIPEVLRKYMGGRERIEKIL
jgi:seryl-tRNA synthetase